MGIILLFYDLFRLPGVGLWTYFTSNTKCTDFLLRLILDFTPKILSRYKPLILLYIIVYKTL